VTFTSRSTPGSSPIVSYHWDLGTRSASAASTADVSVTTSFSQPGTYTIRLSVTDANGLSDDDTHQITIAQQAQPPTALIEGPTQASVGEPVTFTSRSTPGSSPIVSYHWDLGTRSASAASTADVSVTTSFSQPGTYTIRLSVTDANGLSDDDTHQITIAQQAQPPTARIEGPTQASVGEPVTFTSRSTPGSSPIVSYHWDLGTREASAAPTADVSVTTSFSQPGSYTIRLSVTDANGLSDDDTHQITIVEAVQPPVQPVPPVEPPVQPIPPVEPPVVQPMPPIEPPPSGGEIEGPTWTLVSPSPMVPITANFIGGTITGHGGCNQYSGNYSLGGDGQISVFGLSSSQMACPQEVAQQESRYLNMLGSANRYQIQGSNLTLQSAQGSLVYSSLSAMPMPMQFN
ncbi:MAG: PKD domain-containing protein, partial [Chloroflexota bacterium]|nr:PKD domain-containing protein [Chloroflexota bacterium]